MGQVGAETGLARPSPGRPSRRVMAGSNNHYERRRRAERCAGASGQVGIERDHNYDYGGLWPSESHTVDNVDPED
jgi:hypothetical protein